MSHVIIVGLTLKDINFSKVINDKINFFKSKNKCYDKLCKIFTDIEHWDINNLLCWSCHQPFDWVPIAIPLDWGENLNMRGNFCSPSCAKTYIYYINDPLIHDREESCELLIKFIKEKLNISEPIITINEPYFYDERYSGY